ncbi:hypothetical protein HDU86_005453 [Geranomyces michiganensis]|nr:hypothetical protein HDU86_005453 [Geranomyces michiganensis]
MPAESGSPTPGGHGQHYYQQRHRRIHADGPCLRPVVPLGTSDSDFDFRLHAKNPAIIDLVAADPQWATLELPYEEIDVPEKHRPQTDDVDNGPVSDHGRAADDYWHDLDISELTVELAGSEDVDSR